MQELGAGGAKNVKKPTAAGQIPMALLENGHYVYGPSANPIPVPTANDVGKAPVVSSFDQTTNAPVYSYTQIIPEDEQVKSLFNQNGVVGKPSATIGADNQSIIISPFSAVFYDPVTQVRTTITSSSPATVPINPTTAQQITYVYVKPDGTFGLDYTLVANRVYLFEVITPTTAPLNIISYKPIYTIYDSIQSTVKNYGTELGIEAYNFAMSYSVTTNKIGQTSTSARLVGYNLNPGDVRPSVRPFAVNSAITFDYWAFTVADRALNTDVVIRQYKIDNPNTATSTNITGNNFGIVLIYGSINGKYKLLAPQLSYTSEAVARSSVLTYIRTVVVPRDIAEVYAPIAALYVPANVATNTALNIDIVSGVALGGAPLQDSAVLPAPTVAGYVKVPAGGGSYIIDSSATFQGIDFSTAQNGQVVTAQNQAVKFDFLNTILPSKEFANQRAGMLRLSDTVVLATGGDFDGAGLTFTISVVDAPTKKKKLTINGSNKLIAMGGFWQGNFAGQAKFDTDGRNNIDYISDQFIPGTVTTWNPQGVPYLDMLVYYIVGA